MPAIRKIRIVNFRFNDGAKLIPDEIFCTENSEGKPMDTLLNLDNGGGKSVMVQLLLQPVCPKAKVQNRHISEYFRKGTDHAFVLIEWALDDSPNSLLTGIALAASVTADDENERKAIRYYTFMHSYNKNDDTSDIVNLPLSEHTGSRIRPLSYEELRKYLQNRKIECYSSDSLRRYQNKLQEYGILHTEWENLLVRINSVEGGITKFFEEYKTADRLLDRFIIPGVMPDDVSAAEALEEMFIHYADSYSGQEENIRLQSQIKKFTEKLQGTLPLIKDMWNADEAKTQSVHALADYLLTIERKIEADTAKKSQLEESIDDLKARLHRIQAEKASKAFYRAKEVFDSAEKQLKESAKRKENAEMRLDSATRMVNVLNAAKEYAEIIEKQNEEKALIEQITALDNGTQDTRILSLKYSLLLKAANGKKQTEQEISYQRKSYKCLSDELSKKQSDISRLRQQLSNEKAALNQSKGKNSYICGQIEKVLKSLGLHITVMLDGRYSAYDIESICSRYERIIGDARKSIESFEHEEKKLKQELDGQYVKRDKLTRLLADNMFSLKQQKAESDKYKKDYQTAITVLKHLSVPENRLFSDEPISCLDRILTERKEKMKQTERLAELLTEQVRCIETGQLHISKAAVSFLQESGISYQTGEQYLLCQSPTMREKLLSFNSLIAYAVIVDSEKERLKLLSQSVDDWLPAVVPVYTRKDIADMADGNLNITGIFLSGFDREYFHDNSAYAEHISNRLEDVKASITQIQHYISDWESERRILSRFISSYSADYERLINESIISFEDGIKKINNELSEFDRRKAEIEKQTDNISRLKNEQQDIIRRTEAQKAEFERICKMISQYEELSKQTAEMESSCHELDKQIKSEYDQEKRLNELITECNDCINRLVDKLTAYQDLLNELKDTPKTELLTEEYSAMLKEYRLYQESYSKDRRVLLDKCQKIRKDIHKKEREIKRFHLETAEYENTVYSDDYYNHARERAENAKKEFEQTDKQYSEASRNHIKAESSLEQAKEKLNELNTELLDYSEVGSDFELRIQKCEFDLKKVENDLNECIKHLNGLISDQKYANNFAKKYRADIEKYTPKFLNEQPDINVLQETIEKCIEHSAQAERQAKDYHRRELEPFRNTHDSFNGTLDHILFVMDNNDIAGDKYFTLYERIEDDVRRYRDRITQLSVMLRDVEDSKKQLVTNCLQRVGRLYENLTILSKKSAIQVGNTKRRMIQIAMPEIEPMNEQAAERVEHYISEQVKRYLSEPQKTTVSHHHLEIRRLLNCYIGKETIPITVFKIDKNIQNSRYRSWEDALKANSGGEQFVVLFSLIVSVMNYTRSLTSSLNHTSGVLILDNPFGPISSPHLLEPMFRIAHLFHIQLICFTHLGTAAVTSFFDIVYQLRFKNLPLSNVEILESEAKHHMEHAYYLSEQLSLF